MLPTYTAVRYITPLREGGSLPAIVETDEGGMFATKFRGAGQGAKALIAELIVGGIATALGFDIPDVVLIDLDEAFGRSERDPEIQELLRASHGTNVGLRYLPGSLNYDPVALPDIDPVTAADIVWLDALTTNIDRTPRNPNMMIWEGKLWLIDHGAALYFHHNWTGLDDARIMAPFPQIKDHVLLPAAGDILESDARLSPRVSDDLLKSIVDAIPDQLLMDCPPGTEPAFPTAEENRAAYRDYFARRLAEPRQFATEAARAAELRRSQPQQRQSYRR
jgi:hypothetical protein